MNEVFLLYLLTRLDVMNSAAWWIVIGFGCGLFFTLSIDDYEPGQDCPISEKLLEKWYILAIALLVIMLVPSQKEATFILAGTGVIEAAKSDTAKSIAGKSVKVIEKYLDDALK